jgi:hypothetical protein
MGISGFADKKILPGYRKTHQPKKIMKHLSLSSEFQDPGKTRPGYSPVSLFRMAISEIRAKRGGEACACR